MKNPKISILIVTFQNERDIKACINSLWDQEYQDFEVIIIDNNSMDSTIESIAGGEKNGNLQIISLKENKGFTGGNIEGLKIAKGEFVALLNPDTEAMPHWLDSLINVMDKHPEVGICASKLIVSGSNLIDSAGDGCTTTGKGYKRGEGNEIDLFNQLEYVFGACGGAMLIRRSVIEEIGFLDDAFFLIHEDTDFCFRAQLAGWKCMFVPNAMVHHRVGASLSKYSDMKIYYAVRNTKLVMMKNMPFRLLLKYWIHIVIQDVGIFLYFGMKHKRCGIVFKAMVDSIALLPDTLRKRRQVLKLRKIGIQELNDILTSIWQSGFFHKKMQKLKYH